MKYSIPSRTTLYKGVLFRSALEARIAVLFDLCPQVFCQWEYEPFQSKGYMPDFGCFCPSIGTYVVIEIKPGVEFINMDKYANSLYGDGHPFVIIFQQKHSLRAICFNSNWVPLQDWLNSWFSKSRVFKQNWELAEAIVKSESN